MAEDTVARTLGGSHAEIGKTIRLIIASPVHLVGDGATTLRCRADVIVVDVIDLGPQASQRSPTAARYPAKAMPTSSTAPWWTQ
jgi:hypothetical protein